MRAPSRLLRSPLATAAGLSAVGIGVAGLVRLAYSVLVGRDGGPSALAAVNASISLALLASMLGPSAAGSAASKFVARASGAGGGAPAAAAHLLRRTALLAPLLAVGAAAASVLVLDGSWSTAAGVAFLVLSVSAYLFTRGVLLGLGRVARTAVAEGVSAVVAVGLLTGVLAAGWSALVLAPLGLGYLAYAALAWPRGVLRPGGRPHPAQRRELDAFLGWGVLGSVCSAGLMQLSVVVAAGADTPRRAGLYAAAVAVGTPAASLAAPLAQVLFPSMARAAGGGDLAAVRRQTDVATRGLVLVLGVAFGSVFLLAAPLLRLAYDERFLAAVPLLQLVVVAVLLSTVTVPAVSSLTSGSADGVRLVARTSAAGFATGTAVMVAAAPVLGVGGVVVGYLVGTLVTNALPWWVVWHRHGHDWGRLSARVLGAVAVLALLGVLQQRLPADAAGAGATALAVALAAGFSGLWLLAGRRDVRLLLAGPGPGTTSGRPPAPAHVSSGP